MNDQNFDSESIVVLDYLLPLLKQRWLVFGGCCLGAAVGVAIALLQTPVYTATAKFMPRGALGESNELQGLTGETGSKDWRQVRSDADIAKYYDASLKTRPLLTRLLNKEFTGTDGSRATLFDLLTQKDQDASDLMEFALEKLRKDIRLDSGGGRIVKLSYTFPDRRLAADVVNALLDEFIRQPAQTQRTSETVEIIGGLMAQVRSDLNDKESQIAREKSKTLDMTFQTPDALLAIAALERDARMLENRLQTLSAEYAKAEIRRVQTQRGSLQEIDVIDSAWPPLRRSNSRTRIVLVAVLLAGILSVGLACSIEFLRSLQSQFAGHAFWTYSHRARRDIILMGALLFIAVGMLVGYIWLR